MLQGHAQMLKEQLDNGRAALFYSWFLLFCLFYKNTSSFTIGHEEINSCAE